MKCAEEKSASDFYASPSRPADWYCKPCRKNYVKGWQARNPARHAAIVKRSHLRRTLGITSEQKDEMFAAQGRKCGACGTDSPGTKKGWHVDHCHATKSVRGVLCMQCNLALGCVKDSTERLLLLVSYLERSRK